MPTPQRHSRICDSEPNPQSGLFSVYVLGRICHLCAWTSSTLLRDSLVRQGNHQMIESSSPMQTQFNVYLCHSSAPIGYHILVSRKTPSATPVTQCSPGQSGNMIKVPRPHVRSKYAIKTAHLRKKTKINSNLHTLLLKEQGTWERRSFSRRLNTPSRPTSEITVI